MSNASQALSQETSCDPSALQRIASTPENSVWVDASAGTGKTKVLTDRVLRFLLQGIAPSKVLCLTFTKAAAAEMQHRLFESLSTWSTCSRPHLINSLTDLLGQAPSPQQTKKARVLFFELIDDAYGLKVLTIHSFCQQILGRFPLEADLPVKVSLMDQNDQQELLQQATDHLISLLDKDPDCQKAFDHLSSFYKPHSLPFTIQNIILDSKSRRHLAKHTLIDLTKNLEAHFGFPVSKNPDDILKNHPFSIEKMRLIVEALEKGSATDQKKAAQVRPFSKEILTSQNFEAYCQIFFTLSGTVRQRFATQKVLENHPWLEDFFYDEVDKLLLLKEKINTLTALQGSHAFMVLSQKLLSLYTDLKHKKALLDFDDLIATSAQLLSKDQGVSWVLYKLDGGIDHILVDEAQDTSPDQWQIILKLAEDFFAGETARLLNRTLFVVGDRKQSIYSFQGAEPDLFLHLRHFFQEKVEQSRNSWKHVSLDVSFRSCQAVLGIVDDVFKKLSPDLQTSHESFRPLDGGKVQLWPLVSCEKSKQNPDAYAPSPSQILATTIAKNIKDRLIEKELLPAKGRAVQVGDFLILVQRRSAFMYQVIRALKRQNIPVAGPDRFALMDHLAVQDLLSLASFLLLPEDNYALACVLKSPLFNLSEEDLLILSEGRGSKSLWASLSASKTQQEIRQSLLSLLKKVDQLSPYALFAHVLTSLKGRQKFRARLSDDCDDALDEFLNVAFDYSHEKSNGLQGFVEHCQLSNPDVKRDFSSAKVQAVRIMTVHGAKGLQAPIVFLPDTTRIPSQYSFLLWQQTDQGKAVTPLWRTPLTLSCEKTDTIKEQEKAQQMAEYYRLLYVALTRAEDELVIAGWETTRETSDQCWYRMVEPSLRALGFQQSDDRYLYECPQQRQIPFTLVNTTPRQKDAPPPWLFQNPASEIGDPEPCSPSSFFTETSTIPLEKTVSPSLLQEENMSPYAEGSYIHKLLEILPEHSHDQWDTIAQNQAVHYDISPYQSAFECVKNLLTHPDFSDIFGENSYAEVSVSGEIQGQRFNGEIDRLLIIDHTITLIDFKSNKVIPPSLEEVPQHYLGQLFIYRELLQKIYPHHEILCELIWVRNTTRMAAPSSFLDAFHNKIC